MKQCDSDGCENEATVHLTKVVEDGIKKEHLCKDCASKHGVDTDPPTDMSEFLAQVGAGSSSSGGRSSIVSTCPSCGMDRPRLKKSMRLGCRQCYDVFSEDLENVIQSMHHSDQHVGKVPSSEGKRAQLTRQLAILQEKLGEAVLNEQFEQAATLRDQIKALQTEMVS